MLPRVVVDTNTLVQAVPRHGRFHAIFLALRDRRFELVISNEIMLEYEEVLLRLGSPETWPSVAHLLKLLHRFGTVILVKPTYKWNAIASDVDDNKFVDAAVCGDALYVVTQDNHFNELSLSTLVSVRPISPLDFLSLLESSGSITPNPTP